MFVYFDLYNYNFNLFSDKSISGNRVAKHVHVTSSAFGKLEGVDIVKLGNIIL